MKDIEKAKEFLKGRRYGEPVAEIMLAFAQQYHQEQLSKLPSDEDIPLSNDLLETYGFKYLAEGFPTLQMNYYVKEGVCLFFNAHRTKWELDSYLVGFGEMRQGEYHVTTFRWIKNLQQLKEIYESITNKKMDKR